MYRLQFKLKSLCIWIVIASMILAICSCRRRQMAAVRATEMELIHQLEECNISVGTECQLQFWEYPFVGRNESLAQRVVTMTVDQRSPDVNRRRLAYVAVHEFCSLRSVVLFGSAVNTEGSEHCQITVAEIESICDHVSIVAIND